MTKQTHEVLEGVAACIGIHSGILPFVFKLTGWHVSGLALPLLLPDPAALMAADGRYAELHNTQFREEPTAV